jgi:exosome complex exonuclease RRP6
MPFGHPAPATYRAEPGVHPLRAALEALTYPAAARACGGLTLPTPLAESEAIFVDSEAALSEMAEHLDRAQEFAVDLEHHSYRSFQGFTCLMQVSLNP